MLNCHGHEGNEFSFFTAHFCHWYFHSNQVNDTQYFQSQNNNHGTVDLWGGHRKQWALTSHFVVKKTEVKGLSGLLKSPEPRSFFPWILSTGILLQDQRFFAVLKQRHKLQCYTLWKFSANHTTILKAIITQASILQG